jgi:hypothetical protein
VADHVVARVHHDALGTDMWWHMSTTMRLAHTPEPDTIAFTPVRRQRDAKGLDTLARDTPVRMYRQRPPAHLGCGTNTQVGPYPSVCRVDGLRLWRMGREVFPPRRDP